MYPTSISEVAPLNDDERKPFIKFAFAVDEAHSNVRQLFDQNPLRRDLFPIYEAIVAWPFAISCFSGIEQAMKLLLRIRGMSYKYNHDLEALYERLDNSERVHLEDHFREYRSLHNYETGEYVLNTANQFIRHINTSKSGKKREGYTPWRYLLIEGADDVPTLHIGSMLEIWCALCCIIRRRVLGRRDECDKVYQRLLWECGLFYRLPSGVDEEETFLALIEYQQSLSMDDVILLLDKVKRCIGYEASVPAVYREKLITIAKTVLLESSADLKQWICRYQEDGLIWKPNNRNIV